MDPSVFLRMVDSTGVILLQTWDYTPSNKENSPCNVSKSQAGEALIHQNNHTLFFLILREPFEANSVP